MPYIKPEDRSKYQNHIEAVIGIMSDPNDAPYIKGEFFGYFVNRLARRFLGAANYSFPAFNSSLFNQDKKKALDNAADSISAALNRSDPISGAGDMNYAISAIYWGFLGCSSNCPSVGYGVRAYLNGVIDTILSQMTSAHVPNASQKDATMEFRRLLVIRGVLDHIKHETYQVLTIPYEMKKQTENGMVWKDGKLVS